MDRIDKVSLRAIAVLALSVLQDFLPLWQSAPPKLPTWAKVPNLRHRPDRPDLWTCLELHNMLACVALPLALLPVLAALPQARCVDKAR